MLRVVAGGGGKTARVNLTPTLVEALETTAPERRTGYVLPCRTQQAVYKRLKVACRQARVTPKSVHALRHASGTRPGMKPSTLPLSPTTCGTRA